MNNAYLSNENVLLRLIELGYEDVDSVKFIEELKRIYLEESGEELDVDISYISTDDFKEFKNDKSGYDAIAIHLYSKQKETNEVYIISEGSNDKTDWTYNIRSVFAGNEANQAVNTEIFTDKAVRHFNNEKNLSESPRKIGLGHSLANNNNILAHLIFDTFDEIYGVNGAQPNVLQLYNTDRKFRNFVKKEFDLPKFNDDIQNKKILTENLNSLEELAWEFYGQNDNIFQRNSTNDLLFGGMGTTGYLEFGEIHNLPTNLNYPGLRGLMDEIPDEVIVEFRVFAQKYSDSYDEFDGDHTEIIKDLTGYDIQVVNSLKKLNITPLHNGKRLYEFTEMLVDMKSKAPELIKLLTPIIENRDIIISSLKDNQYLSDTESEFLTKTFDSFEENLSSLRDLDLTDLSTSGLKQLVLVILDIHNDYENLMNYGESFFIPLLKEIVHSHSIEEMLNALNKENGKSYIGDAMLVTANQDGKEIVVNITDAVQMFLQGEAVLQEKKTEVEKLQTVYMIQIEDAYKYETRKLIDVIYHMEENPAQYAYSILRKHVPFSRNQIMLKEIKVHETLEPLQGVSFTDVYDQLMVSITRAEEFLSSSRTALEQIFEEDEVVSGIFKHSLPERGTQ